MIGFFVICGLIYAAILLVAFYHRDLQAIFHGDPAAKNIFEVLTYPGLYAISVHRINHFLWKMGIPFIPRLISQLMRLLTLIEIHPGAYIGKGFFIDLQVLFSIL